MKQLFHAPPHPTLPILPSCLAHVRLSLVVFTVAMASLLLYANAPANVKTANARLRANGENALKAGGRPPQRPNEFFNKTQTLASPPKPTDTAESAQAAKLTLHVAHYLLTPNEHEIFATQTTIAQDRPLYITTFTFQLASGYHINSPTPLDSNLIPTQVVIKQANFTETATTTPWGFLYIAYPPPTIRELHPQASRERSSQASAADQTVLDLRISIYEEKPYTIIALYQPPINSPPAPLPIHTTFHYQVCSDDFCYPPTRSETTATLPAMPTASVTPPATLLKDIGALVVANPTLADPTTAAELVAAEKVALAWEKLLLYLSFAFLGGLILNFMPCVLPVVYLKIFSLLQLSATIKNQTDSTVNSTILRSARTNLASFGAGIYFVFFVVALLALILHLAGTYIGWGLQFQNVGYVFALAALTWYLGLYLLGVYNIPFFNVSWQTNVATAKKVEKQGKEHFFWGILTALLATPCTAPLLAPAIGYLFSRSWWELTLAIHLTGIGLAFPYWLGALFPRWMNVLVKLAPAPGKWMHLLQQLFAASLLLISLWLMYILLVLSSAATLFLYFLYLWGGTLLLYFTQNFNKKQHAPPLALRQRYIKKLGWVGFFLLTLWLGRSIFYSVERTTFPPNTSPTTQTAPPLQQKQSLYPKQIMTEASLQQALNQRSWVFVHITAEWCLSCKVNEKLILHSAPIQALFKKYDVIYLQGDWTRPNPFINAYLARHQRRGIPFDAIYDPTGNLTILNEVLTKTSIQRRFSQYNNTLRIEKENE